MITRKRYKVTATYLEAIGYGSPKLQGKIAVLHPIFLKMIRPEVVSVIAVIILTAFLQPTYGQDNECGCINGGTCVTVNETSECLCVSGYTGSTCETDIDECMPDPCVNGNCSDSVNAYSCSCNTDWVGINCDEEEDSCPCAPSDCTGRHCDVGNDDVAEGQYKTCVDGVGGFQCVCQPGWMGADCDQDINECSSDPCGNGLCDNTPGSFSCTCNQGWTGSSCSSDIDECLEEGNCFEGTCQNGDGTYTCTCFDGYEGVKCNSDINECLAVPSPCRNNGRCTNSLGSFVCTCTPSWDGSTCEQDVNECLAIPCLNGGTCINTDGSFTCSCVDTFTGPLCAEDRNECLSGRPCGITGTCINQAPGFSCNCNRGWTGASCETDIDECESSPCLNGASCIDGTDGYHCECAPGWSGSICQENVDECLSSPCDRGVFSHFVCADGINEYSCVCPSEYVGESCSIAAAAVVCIINECQNNGTCLPDPPTFRCVCPVGRTGATCESEQNLCEPNPCNGGTCTPAPGGFTCSCPPGVTGKTCAIDIDECVTRELPCGQNNERYNCQNNLGSFTCSCLPGLTGANCIAPDQCGIVCGDFGFCTLLNGDPSCSCQQGFRANEDASGCIDINEGAEGGTLCDPDDGIVVNTVGSYECRCPANLDLDPETFICIGRREWLEWGSCDTSCGPGQRTRTQLCKGLDTCESERITDTEDCSLGDCPLSQVEQDAGVIMEITFNIANPVNVVLVFRPSLQSSIARAVNRFCNTELDKTKMCCGESRIYKESFTPSLTNLLELVTDDRIIIAAENGFPRIKDGSQTTVQILFYINQENDNALCTAATEVSRRKKRQTLDSSGALSAALTEAVVSDSTVQSEIEQDFADESSEVLGQPITITVGDTMVATDIITSTVPPPTTTQGTNTGGGTGTGGSGGDTGSGGGTTDDTGVAWWIILLAVIGALLLIGIIIIVIIFVVVKGGSAVHASQENLQGAQADDVDEQEEHRVSPRSEDYRPPSQAWPDNNDSEERTGEEAQMFRAPSRTAWAEDSNAGPSREPLTSVVTRPKTGSGARQEPPPVEHPEEEYRFIPSPPGTTDVDEQEQFDDEIVAVMGADEATHAVVKTPVTSHSPQFPKPPRDVDKETTWKDPNKKQREDLAFV